MKWKLNRKNCLLFRRDNNIKDDMEMNANDQDDEEEQTQG